LYNKLFKRSPIPINDWLGYCSYSDAYKVLHPDVVFKDMYVWKEGSRENLRKRITTEKAYAVLPDLSRNCN
jgi:hypothetical protein